MLEPRFRPTSSLFCPDVLETTDPLLVTIPLMPHCMEGPSHTVSAAPPRPARAEWTCRRCAIEAKTTGPTLDLSRSLGLADHLVVVRKDLTNVSIAKLAIRVVDGMPGTNATH